ncbi:MAG: ClbS/DfsB family four-helix bundle protein [Anaerolinea sp.]|nr:ClbS/DfsB family four-helix bundle protein [Anaerolinea sp.]
MADQFDKDRLLKSLQAQRLMLEVTLEQLLPEDMLLVVEPGIMTVKDIVSHVNLWDQRGTVWLQEAARGETPTIPLPGKTWHDLDALNQEAYEAHKDDPLAEVLETFAALFPPLLEVVKTIPPEGFKRRFRYFNGDQDESISVARLVQWRYHHYLSHGQHIRNWMKGFV